LLYKHNPYIRKSEGVSKTEKIIIMRVVFCSTCVLSKECDGIRNALLCEKKVELMELAIS
jgi:hypothetical protein